MSVSQVLNLIRHCEPWYDLAFVALAIGTAYATLGDRFRASLYWSCVGAAFALARLPNILTAATLQIDECGLAANALRALRFPIPWSGFDGFTSGPLDSLVMVPFVTVPARALYASIRCEGLLLTVATVLLAYSALSVLTTKRNAALGTSLLVFFFVASPEFDLAAFTTETLPNALFACAVLALAYGYRFERNRARCAIVASSLAGAMCFAKLQAAPLAAVTVVAAFACVARVPERDARVRGAFGVIAGFLVVPALCVIPAISVGKGRNVLVSFLLQPHAYVAPPQLDPGLFVRTYAMAVFFCGSFVLTLVALVRTDWRSASLKSVGVVGPLGASVLCSIAAAAAAYAPGRNFPHYTLLAVLPAVLVVALSIALYRASMPRGTSAGVRVIEWCSAILVVALAGSRFVLGDPGAWRLQGNDLADSATVLRLVADHAPHGSTTAVWGFDPGIYVATGTTMATEDSNTEWEIEPGPYRDYFRARYLAELVSSAPSVFVDDVAPHSFWFGYANARYEHFPALRAYIDARYRLAGNVDGVRVFVRKT